ncbi:hypothetical protein K1T71_014315 [Dendrolimus kikuchii]|uniref:Uncharacterized protein n=1 Tax=Dendrolimus kikuchii TaxID=765133 RepID=A0ACC1CFP1_9NEOP|nr:hypothetical protein K1T71_014315 [Dendrolimus kikuchii]
MRNAAKSKERWIQIWLGSMYHFEETNDSATFEQFMNIQQEEKEEEEIEEDMTVEVITMDKVAWTNEYMEMFGLAFIKYEPLYQKPKTNSLNRSKKRLKVTHCHKQLARELGWRSFRKSSIVHQCVTFKKKFADMLRQLVWNAADEASAEEVLRAAPVWVRTVEAALQCMPTIKAEANSSTWSSPKVVSLLASRLAGQMAREALRRRSVRADALAPAHARLAALTAQRLDAATVHGLWERVKSVSLGKLALSVAAGDNALGVAEGARLEPHDWLVLDALLLYADTAVAAVTGAESYLLYEQLQPLIDVFHLAQMHHLEDPDHAEPLAVRWTRAYNNYVAKGLSASLVLLQRRWYELKHWARRGVLGRWRRCSECQLYPLA